MPVTEPTEPAKAETAKVELSTSDSTTVSVPLGGDSGVGPTEVVVTREVFEAQTADFRATVLPPGVPVLSVEAAVTFGWARWADASVGIDRGGS